MSRYIDANKVDDIEFWNYEKSPDAKVIVELALKSFPTEEVAPIIRGKCSITHGMYENRIWCNNCGFIKVITGEEENYNFCPKCGALAERSKQ